MSVAVPSLLLVTVWLQSEWEREGLHVSEPWGAYHRTGLLGGGA